MANYSTENKGSGLGKGDFISLPASTTSELLPGQLVCFSSGFVNKVIGAAPTTLAGAAGLAGVLASKKATQTTATRTSVIVQQSGIAAIHVTEEQAATVLGQALALSATTADLGTIIATLDATSVIRPVHAAYIGPVVKPAATTGATTSTSTTVAEVYLTMGAR